MVSKIIYMLEDIGALGGVQRHVQESTKLFNSLGYEVEIISRFEASGSSGNLPAKVTYLYDSGFFQLQQERRDGAADAAAEIIEQEQKAQQTLNELLRDLPEDTVVIAVQYGMLYELDRGGWLDAERSFQIVAAYHSSYEYARAQPYFNLLISLLRRSDVSVFLTEHDRRNFEGMGLPHTVTIPNAVSPHSIDKESTRGDHAVYLGRLDAEKGVIELVETWIQALRNRNGVPDLHIYGTGELEEELESLVVEAGLENQIRLCGRTSAPYERLAQAQMVVSCSPNEGFPMTLLEAAVVGTPSVVYNAGPGTAELVRDQQAGLMVTSGDRTAFINAVLQLQEESALREYHSAKAREAAESYSPLTILERWKNLFKDLRTVSDKTGAVGSENVSIVPDDKISLSFALPQEHICSSVVLLLDYISFEPRSFLALIRAFNEAEANISDKVFDLVKSGQFNSHFVNSPGIDFEEVEPMMVLPVKMKTHAAEIEIDIIKWGLERHSPSDSIRGVFIETKFNGRFFYFPASTLNRSMN